MLSGIVLRSATVFSVSGFLVCGLAFGENGDCVEIVEWVKHVGGVCRWSVSVECVEIVKMCRFYWICWFAIGLLTSFNHSAFNPPIDGAEDHNEEGVYPVIAEDGIPRY